MNDVDALKKLVGELEEQMQTPMPPVIRQEQQRGLDIALLMLDLLERGEEEFADAKLADLETAYRNIPRPLKGTARFDVLKALIEVRSDTDPWEVWIRWDRVPSNLRDDVIVLANLWTDAIRGRPIGRPKKTS